jgi:hypothetical protein
MKKILFGNTVRFSGSFFILLTVLLLQTCKKGEIEQPQAVLSADGIVVYSPHIEFSLLLSISPPVKDKWQITSLPDYLIAEPMSGEINNSIQEIGFRFNKEYTQATQYPDKNIEVLTEKSGSAKTAVQLQLDKYIELVITPEAIHFEEGVEQLTFFIENKSPGTKRLNLKTQHSWLKLSNNYLVFPPYSTIELQLTADWYGLSQGTVYSSIYLTESWPNSPILIHLVEVKVDIPHHKKLVADKPEILCNYFESEVDFYLINKGNSPIEWQSSTTAEYITINPAQGNLAVGDSIMVSVDVDKSELESQSYEEMLMFGWDNGVFELPIQVNHYGEWTLVSDDIVDVKHWQQANKLVILYDTPPSLVIFDPETLQADTMALQVAPRKIIINQDVGLVNMSTSSQLLLVDLNNTAIISDIVLPTSIGYYIFADNQKVYYTHSNALYFLDLSSGNTDVIASNLGQIRGLIKHPFQDEFFLITTTSINKYDFSNDNVTLVWSQTTVPTFYSNKAWVDMNQIKLVDKIGGIYATQNGISYIGGLNLGDLLQFTSSLAHNLSFAVSENSRNMVHVFDAQIYDSPIAMHSLPDMINFYPDGTIKFFQTRAEYLFVNGETRELYVVAFPNFSNGYAGVRKINF